MKKYNLKFISPTFCSGADQAKAEIRATSIIGELRWWFRVLHGTKNESAVFGGITGSALKSKVTVRVSNKNIISDSKELPSMRMGQPLSYLLYYANASGKNRGDAFGPRFKQNGFISPETTFTLSISVQKNLDKQLQTDFEHTLNAFVNLGSIGLRSTRACGAFTDIDNILSFEEFKQNINYFSNTTILWIIDCDDKPAFQDDWKSVMYLQESFLKKMRKKYSAGKSGENLTGLGSSGNKRENVDRQRSALKLRPVLLKEGILPVVIYTEKILDSKCEKIDLDQITFNHPFDPKNNSGDYYSLV